jgi:hypothetical protein
MMQLVPATRIPETSGSSFAPGAARGFGKAPALSLLALIAALLAGCSSGGGPFSSHDYGYTAALPTGWGTSHQADSQWNGIGSPSFEDSDVDLFYGPDGIVVMAYAARSSQSLAAYTRTTIQAAAAAHQCPAHQASQAITLGGAPAQLLSMDCQGLPIETAITLHAGKAIVFASQIPSGTRADRAALRKFLASIRFQQ